MLVVVVIALGVSVLLEEDSEEETACEEITYEEIADEEIRIPVRFQVISEEEQAEIILQSIGEVGEIEKIENSSLVEEVKKDLSDFLLAKYQYDANEKLTEATFYRYAGKDLVVKGFNENR